MPISARLIAAAMPDWPPLPAADAAIVRADVTAYVEQALKQAPFHLRAGVRVLDILFALYAVFRGAAANREKVLSGWSRLTGLTAMHVRLYRSLVMLAAYEHRLMQQPLGREDPHAHRQEFRARRAAAGGTE